MQKKQKKIRKCKIKAKKALQKAFFIAIINYV